MEVYGPMLPGADEYEWAARAVLLGAQGMLSKVGRSRVMALVDNLTESLHGHLDGTGMPCRMDLRGHDCCYVCNQTELMLMATAQYMEELE